ncbi:SusC/RagA family TonB-linked outer membrane protein [Pedobacter sp. SD-b]|uniref:SusC/RagA family TonB-linked outer membrane protein n=1 Tax=Pedobacter segetis TaxID=2793069 RepID=A0ABS1BN04_9SPHI|nr:SusC/RagA family TonB-linked outer membrane protein [Pedobacter segetis]MBK0384268.1 SusC/RagA family TonB-linked outer membrane protein [Pedobacter segetis]
MRKKSTYSTTMFVVLFLLMAFVLPSFAQKKIRINVRQATLNNIFSLVEDQSNLAFAYDPSDINVNQKLSIDYGGELNGFLTLLSAKTELDFKIVGKTISVRKSTTKNLPTRIITGIVTDKTDNETIPGVNVFIKDTKKGAVTNINGEFTLKITDNNIDNTVLAFNFLGMKPKEVLLGKQSFLRVELERDAIMMNDVVVTSSYTKDKRREEVVGSISQLNATQLQTTRPIESFDKMMEGLIAGVQVETNTELGTPVKVNIRGIGSLPSFGNSTGTSSQPLYVIDGIPLYEQQRKNESGTFNNETYLNPLSNINPDDIQSISVLKDATASALYGANAANGVIIITTKSGVAGNTKLSFGFDAGTTQFINQYKWLSGNQYYRLLREAYINDGRSYAQATQLAGSPDINTDWFGLTTRNAAYQNATLDISGGNEGTTFRLSTGYRKEQASSYGNDLEKIYARLKLDHQFNHKFSLGVSLSPTFTKKNDLSNYGGVILAPNVAPINPDGTYPDILGVPNPLAILAQNQDFHKGFELLGNVNASYKINKEITLSGTLGTDFYQNRETVFKSAKNATGRNANGNLIIYNRNYVSLTGFAQATYDKTFANKHTVNFLIGSQVENKETNLLRGSGTGFNFDRLRVLNAAQKQTSSSSRAEDATVSYYSQLGYDIFKKYFFNLNGRVDESSVFGGDKQVALNGSIGASWIISKENFLKDNKTINSLRLRTTYGSTGNSRIGTYAARGLYSFSTSSGNLYNGNIASTPDGSAAPNPNLGWEKNYKFNVGLDLTLFNKIQITTEYYNNTIVDLISSVAVPYETGFTTILANTSKMRNKGIELTINSENIRKTNFGWNTAFNFGKNKNTLLSFNKGFGALYSPVLDASALKVGQSVTAIYGFNWVGVDPQTGLEQFNVGGNILGASEVNKLDIFQTSVLGDRNPNFQGGIVNSFRVYDFDLSFNILYSYGADKFINYADEADGRNLANRNQSINLLDRWQRPGDVTNIPRLDIIRAVVSNSSRYVLDASYLKFSNVNLSYRLPDALNKRLHLSKATINANVTNLFYIYKDQGTKGRNGIAEKRFVFPETRAFVLGLKVGL